MSSLRALEEGVAVIARKAKPDEAIQSAQGDCFAMLAMTWIASSGFAFLAMTTNDKLASFQYT